MPITNYAIEMMGFKKITDVNPLQASFKSVNVYKIEGLKINDYVLSNLNKLALEEKELKILIGEDLNAICNFLLGESFVDNLDEWQTENKASPPYLVVVMSLIAPQICVSGWRKDDLDGIMTYDSFSMAKTELLKQEKLKVIPILGALSIILSKENNLIKFSSILREVIGRTPENVKITDIKITSDFTVSTAKGFATDELSQQIQSVFSLSKKIHEKVAYFFDLAIRESDSLKKFLYYFLVIEVHTHQAFKALNHSSIIEINTIPDRMQASSEKFLTTLVAEAKNLTQRFIWCSLLRWNGISDRDIEIFKRVKTARDKIYHGEDININKSLLIEIENLAIKIIKNDLSNDSA